MVSSNFSATLLNDDKKYMPIKSQINHILQQIEEINHEINRTQHDINKLRAQIAINESAINHLLSADR